MKRYPWFPQYAGDLRGNWRLMRCSLSAQGLFFALQLLAHDGFGRIVFHGVLSRDSLIAEIAAATWGKSIAEIAAALDELIDAGVVTIAGNTITIPCMADEYEYREKCRVGGEKGAQIKREKYGSATLEGTHEGTLKATRQVQHSRSDHNRAEKNGLTPETLLALFNEHRGGLKKAIRLSPSRSKAARAAIRLHPDAQYWIDAVKRAARSEYLPGADWFKGFDHLLKEDFLVALDEGQHDKKFGTSSTSRASTASTGRVVPGIAETAEASARRWGNG